METGRRRSFPGEELMGKDRPTTRNVVLFFRAQGAKRYFAMNLNLIAEQKASR